LDIIIIVLLVYFSAFVIYNLVLSIASLLKSNKGRVISTSESRNRYCFLIPAYKEDFVITHTALNAKLQSYPSDRFDVFVIADNLKDSTIDRLQEEKINIIPVYFDKSTKVKSLKCALNNLKDEFDFVIILDADNIICNDFLSKVDSYVINGYQAIQTKRIPKNLNTSVAILDAVSEAISNNLYRKGAVNLGLSSALIGSGMVFSFNVFAEIISSFDAVGGFDKVLSTN